MKQAIKTTIALAVLLAVFVGPLVYLANLMGV